MTDATTDDDQEFEAWEPGVWMETSGPVPERTNTVINGLLDWAIKADVEVVTRSNIDDAVRSLTPVDTDPTVRDYTERVVEHGPFVPIGAGQWRIDWEYFDG